jgi:hypothetical protein
MPPCTKPASNGKDGEENRYDGESPRPGEANRRARLTETLSSGLTRVVNATAGLKPEGQEGDPNYSNNRRSDPASTAFRSHALHHLSILVGGRHREGRAPARPPFLRRLLRRS